MLVSMVGIFFNKTEEIINPTEAIPEKPEKADSFLDVVDNLADVVIKVANKFGIKPAQLGQMAQGAMSQNANMPQGPMNVNLPIAQNK